MGPLAISVGLRDRETSVGSRRPSAQGGLIVGGFVPGEVKKKEGEQGEPLYLFCESDRGPRGKQLVGQGTIPTATPAETAQREPPSPQAQWGTRRTPRNAVQLPGRLGAVRPAHDRTAKRMRLPPTITLHTCIILKFSTTPRRFPL
jgi:hypothetical protein